MSEVKSGNGSCIGGIVILQDLIGAQAEHKRMDKPRSARHSKWQNGCIGEKGLLGRIVNGRSDNVSTGTNAKNTKEKLRVHHVQQLTIQRRFLGQDRLCMLITCASTTGFQKRRRCVSLNYNYEP